MQKSSTSHRQTDFALLKHPESTVSGSAAIDPSAIQPRSSPKGGQGKPNEPVRAGQTVVQGNFPDEFGRITALCDQALSYAGIYRTPPLPQTYDVWFNYVSGWEPGVVNKINALIHDQNAVTAIDLQQIYSEFLAPDAKLRQRLEEANSSLDSEMADIIEVIQNHLQSNVEYSGSLSRNVHKLTGEPDISLIKETIKLLFEENEQMRKKSSDLATSLENSREQIENLRTELVNSREKEKRDPLTQLANRRGWEERFTFEYDTACRSGQSLVVVLADIDYFKRINDQFGHQIGDEVIRFFSVLIANEIEPECFAARIGGEEFAILMPGHSYNKAKQKINTIREKLAAARLIVTESDQQIGKVTASFGITLLTQSDTISTLFSRADELLYASKNGGRNMIS